MKSHEEEGATTPESGIMTHERRAGNFLATTTIQLQRRKHLAREEENMKLGSSIPGAISSSCQRRKRLTNPAEEEPSRQVAGGKTTLGSGIGQE